MERYPLSTLSLGLAALLVGSCTSTAPSPVAPTSPLPISVASPTPAAEALDRTVTALTGGSPPSGHAVTIDLASISTDRTTLTVRFSGGPAFDPADPCSNHYVPWVASQGDALILDIEEQPSGVVASPGFACPLDAFEHTYRVVLPGPFLGTSVDGIPLLPPGPVSELDPPGDWSVQLSFRQDPGPPVVWARTYGAEPVTNFGLFGLTAGPLDLYQAFPSSSDLLNDSAEASNGAKPISVTVDGGHRTLWLRTDLSPGGRYLLTWSQDGRDLAISADASVLSAVQVVQLANSVTLPG